MLLGRRSRRSDAAAPGAGTAAPAAPFRWRAPEEGVRGPVVLAGEAEQTSPRGRQANGVDVVLQDAVLHVWKGVVAQRLLQEEPNQRGLEGLVAKLAQRLQDASEPQVVVLGPSGTGGENIEHTSVNQSFIFPTLTLYNLPTGRLETSL